MERLELCPVCATPLRRVDLGLYAADPLTVRERTVLRYLGSTLSPPEIAAELSISLNTLKTHQRNIYRKLGAAGRYDAVHRGGAIP